MSNALAAGRMHEAYRLLVDIADKSTDPDQRAALEELLSSRRLFLEPGSPPGMGSFNGVGVKLYGADEQDPRDGTFIATLYLIVAFVPIFPLGEYLVRQVDQNFFRGSWQFFGKAPLSRTHRKWRRIVPVVAAGIVALVAVVSGVKSYVAHQRAPLYATNDLDVAVQIAIGPITTTVPPHDARPLGDIPKGSHHVDVSRASDHRPIESYDVDVAGGEGACVVNVLGASVVYYAEIEYSANPGPGKFEAHPGERFVSFAEVDYPFSKAPEQLETDQSSVTKREIGVVEKAGWKGTVRYLEREDHAAYEALALALGEAEPEEGDALDEALEALQNPEAQLAWLDRVRAQSPGVLDLERARQGVLVALGRRNDAFAEYEARWRAAPDDAHAALLYGVLLPRVEAITFLSGETRKHPDDMLLHSALGHRLFEERRYAEAIPELEATLGDASAHQRIYDDHAAALMAVGRFTDALALQSRLAPSERGRPSIAMIDGALVARARDAGVEGAAALQPERLTHDLDDESRAFLYSNWGIEPTTPPHLSAELEWLVSLQAETRRDPQKALDLLAKGADSPKYHPHPYVAVLLASEASRRGDAALAEKALRLLPPIDLSPALRAFLLEGTESPELDDYPLDMRAALDVARARRQTDEAKRAELLESAKTGDWLFHFAADAATRWPAP
ncbi:MAG TPA: hypothetical protein VL400_05810 [Polyangiaceae bacterium]|nr:hypothetical protein [Polyangiaceae bacterium]